MDTISLIELALQSLPAIPEKTLRILAGRMRLDGRFDAARDVLDELERRLGPSGTIEDGRASILEQEGRLVEARDLREQRCAAYPEAAAWVNLAQHILTFGAEDSDARLGEIDQELAQQPSSDVGLEMIRCEVALARGRLDEAIASANVLFEESKRSSRPGLFLARIALQQGDMATARRYLGHVNRTFGTRTAQAELRLVRDAGGQDLAPDLRELIDAMTRPEPADGGPLVSQLQAIFEAEPEEEAPVVVIEAVDEPTADERVLAVLQDVFGYDELRPGQAEVIRNVLAGTDSLAIMPTGAGKSLTFQIPSLLLDGPVVVVSPLIALMQDQMDGLPAELRKQATFINSSLDVVEMERRRDAIRAGEIRLIYAAPERLRQSEFLDLLRSVGIGLMAIDEAHCVSMWGHDFRPDYYFLTRALEELGDPPVLAITATATPIMEKQIAAALQRPLQTVRTSAFRENLHYSVERHSSQQTKATRLIALCRAEKGPVIVYVPTRQLADDLAGSLKAEGVRAVPYHAGMQHSTRASNQRAFLENRFQVIVATIAFGMGIDKPDVRLIVHMAPSQSLEAYIQESGRAGRDGDISRCILLASTADGGTLRRRANQNTIGIETLRGVYRDLRTMGVGRWVVIDRGDVTALTGDQTTSSVSIGLLEHAGFLRRHPDVGRQITVRWGQRSAESDAAQERDRFGKWLGQISAGSSVVTVPTASACAELDCAPAILERALTAHTGVTAQFRNQAVCLEILPTNAKRTGDVETMLNEMRARESKRVDEMVAYMQGSLCRHRHLARHVGEAIPACGTACDVCLQQSTSFQDVTDRATDAERKKRRLGDPYYAALVAWRRERAREMTVPAFVVASDRLLESLAETKPASVEELGKIKGIGAIKAELYGMEILRVVREVRNQETRAGSR